MQRVEGQAVNLVVRRWPHDKIAVKKQVELHKSSGQRLGLQLEAGSSDGMVKVKNIAHGSPAHACHTLRYYYNKKRKLCQHCEFDVFVYI